MKIIVSHDIDHITAIEHRRDLVLPKSIVRSSVELAAGKISMKEYFLRFREIVVDKIQNIDELMEFDRQHEIPSTFFIAVNRGLGLCYSLNNASRWAKRIIEGGFELGLHGIAFDDLHGIKREYELFREISGLNDFGIRMHYLRQSDNTLDYLNQAGHRFDSSVYRLDNPFKIGSLWEFPLHIMDTYVFNCHSGRQVQSAAEAINTTKKRIDTCHETGFEYLTLLMHDRYFSNAFKSWKEWYIQTIQFLKKNNVEFVNYCQAVKELEK